ncbi:MAG TPA: hypothetical protein PLO51_02380, partial [Candidatus Micrarchaeota archaeon]|nr:hypothetical protein [Candidatus Micrarchaeota archaeon]
RNVKDRLPRNVKDRLPRNECCMRLGFAATRKLGLKIYLVKQYLLVIPSYCCISSTGIKRFKGKQEGT